MNDGFRSGFVSLVGRPNTGKSTLLNALVGQKVAIVADKPQTTRTSIQGVVTRPEAQIVFVDTPGIHKADSPLNKRMMDTVRAALEERDLLLLVVDATRPPGEEDRRAVDLVRKSGTPVVLVLNKIDLLKEKARLLPLISQYKEIHEFADYIPVSAVKGDGLEDLRQAILARLPEGPAYFPEDYVTDQPERFFVAEIVREKVLEFTRNELPFSTAVVVDRFEEIDEKGLMRLYCSILVERDSQKGILVGRAGDMVKRVGTAARIDLEQFFQARVYLDLRVKVRSEWREDDRVLDELGMK